MAATPKTPLEAPDDLGIEVEVANARPRRRGRPPESDGNTEQRILEAARVCFGESGYASTSTHAVAARADLTTGALYHYFGAKRDLYIAVFHQVESVVNGRLRAAAGGRRSLGEKIEAMFDEVVRLNRAEPTMARFMQAVTADMARHPELREAIHEHWPRRDAFFKELVDAAVANGELDAADRRMVIDTINTMLVGLVGISDVMPGAQARAVEGFKRLITGVLLNRNPSLS